MRSSINVQVYKRYMGAQPSLRYLKVRTSQLKLDVCVEAFRCCAKSPSGRTASLDYEAAFIEVSDVFI